MCLSPAVVTYEQHNLFSWPISSQPVLLKVWWQNPRSRHFQQSWTKRTSLLSVDSNGLWSLGRQARCMPFPLISAQSHSLCPRVHLDRAASDRQEFTTLLTILKCPHNPPGLYSDGGVGSTLDYMYGNKSLCEKQTSFVKDKQTQSHRTSERSLRSTKAPQLPEQSLTSPNG